MKLTEQQLLDISDHQESGAYSALEKAVLSYAAAMTRTPADVPGALFDELRGHLDEQQGVELTFAIAHENFRARFNRPFDVQSVGFSEGAVCPVPERPLYPDRWRRRAEVPIHNEKNDDHIVRITIDRPETRNALGLYHFRDLAKAWRDFKDDHDAWVAIVTGVDIRIATHHSSRFRPRRRA